AQGVGAPGGQRVGGAPVHPVHQEARVRGGAIGQLVDVDFGVEVLPAGEHAHHAGCTARGVEVAVVVRGVLLGPGERRAEDGEHADHVREHQTEVGDVTGRQVPHLVRDDEAQRLRVAILPAHLEEVRVDDHEAPEPVPRGEGVDHAVAHQHVRIGDAAHPNCCAASTTIRYPSGNWVGLIRTAEARICAYMIALTHQASTGYSGRVTASWVSNGRTPEYCQ